MKQAVVITILILVTAGQSACAGVLASLKKTDKPDLSKLPYQAADLTIDNQGNELIQTVVMRWRHGGPVFVFPVAVAPHTTDTIRVYLPACSPQQTYDVKFLAGDEIDSPVIAKLDIGIAWPAKYVATSNRIFIDPSKYEIAFEPSQPTVWSASLLKNIFIYALLASCALAGTLFIRRRRRRLAAALAIIALSVGVSIFELQNQKTHQSVIIPCENDPYLHNYKILTSRRTTQWRHWSPLLFPIYYHRQQMADDDMIVHARDGITLTLHPGKYRILASTQSKQE